MKKKGEFTDSQFNRQSAQRAGTLGTKKTRFQYNGKELQDILGIHDDSIESSHQSPLSMIDIIAKNWEDNGEYEQEEDS